MTLRGNAVHSGESAGGSMATVGNGTDENAIRKSLRHLGEAHLGMRRELVQASGPTVTRASRLATALETLPRPWPVNVFCASSTCTSPLF
jgi:hypothetical protein